MKINEYVNVFVREEGEKRRERERGRERRRRSRKLI